MLLDAGIMNRFATVASCYDKLGDRMDARRCVAQAAAIIRPGLYSNRTSTPRRWIRWHLVDDEPTAGFGRPCRLQNIWNAGFALGWRVVVAVYAAPPGGPSLTLTFGWFSEPDRVKGGGCASSGCQQARLACDVDGVALNVDVAAGPQAAPLASRSPPLLTKRRHS